MSASHRFSRFIHVVTMIRALIALLIVALTCLGCVHRIQIQPLSVSPSSSTIPRPLHLVVNPHSIVGADHRQGITLFEWPHQDLKEAILQYMQQRGTFASVSTEPTDLSLYLTTKLTLTSRQNRYHYQIRLQAEMREATQIVKSYRTEQEVKGSLVRWTTASDRDPIRSALQVALDDVMQQIEADQPRYLIRPEQSKQ